MTTSPTVLTIVLNYKTAEMTIRSAEAARRAMEGLSGGIIIVDNDSQDGSFETISAHVAQAGWDADGRVRVVQSGHNGGFGAGNNVGIRAGLPEELGGGAPDYVYILNSDAFPAPDAIRILLEHMQANPKTGFAGSYIHGSDSAPHQSAFRFPSIASEFEGALRLGVISKLLEKSRVAMKPPAQVSSVDWVAGASLMIRQSVLDEIGGFDENFFLYFEEVDLCLRASRAGHQITYVPESRVEHIGSVSTGMKEWKRVPPYWYDSRWYYFSKNHGRLYAALVTMVHLIGGWLYTLKCLILRRKRSVTPGFFRSLLAHDLRALIAPAAEPESSLKKGT